MTIRQLYFDCWYCAALFIACPDCVLAVRIDPETRLPLGHVHQGGVCTVLTPIAEERARSTLEPVCDFCATRRGARDTIAQRHRRHEMAGGL